MFKLFREYISLKVIFLLVTENLLIWGALLFAVNLQSYTRLSFSQQGIEGQNLLVITFLVGLLCQFCMYYTDLYDLTLVCRRSDLMVRLAQATGIWCLLMALAYFVFPESLVGHNVLLLTALLILAGIVLWRECISHAGFLFKSGERILILGTGHIGIDLCRKLLARNDLNLEIAGFLAEEPGRVGERLVNPSIIGTIDELVQIVTQKKINRVVVSMHDRRGRLPVQDLLRLRLQGIIVEDASTLFESVAGRVPIGWLRPSSLTFSDGFKKFRWQLLLKRCFDLVFASLGIVLAFPLMVIVAVCIKLDSEGPILFRQERMGQFEHVFRLLKFRSMRVDSESNGLPCWATQNDPRVTRVGRFLRYCRLDELPQFFNILRGDMSFVGPRPERPYFVQKLKEKIPYYEERHLVKPGLTGWAQIKFHYSSSEDETREKLEYDFFYIKNFSILFDLVIIFQTVKTVLSGQGAR
jgi:sugar transferase (PEP-CTERM system associated)